jgi:hypothetical protein
VTAPPADAPTTSPAAGRGRGLSADDRAVSSVVGKSLELGLLALYVGLLVSTFYGGIVPDYRASADAAVADRTAAALATDVEGAIPATTDEGTTVVAVDVERELDVPRTIGGDPYTVTLDDGALVIDHPSERFARRIPLALPASVDRVEGSVRSGETLVVHVESTASGLVVTLEGR